MTSPIQEFAAADLPAHASASLPALGSPDNARAFREAVSHQLLEHQLGINLSTALLAATLLVVLAVGLSLWWWQRNAENRPRPWLTFLRCARRLGLGWQDRWLLLRVAQTTKLDAPLALLLAHGAFDHHAQLYLRSIPPARRLGQQRRLDRLALRLYPRPATR